MFPQPRRKPRAAGRLCRRLPVPRLPPAAGRSNPEVGRGRRGAVRGQSWTTCTCLQTPAQSSRLILPFVSLKVAPTTPVLSSAAAVKRGGGWDPNPFLGELGAPRPPDHRAILRGKKALAAGAADGARSERRCPSLRLLYYWRHF